MGKICLYVLINSNILESNELYSVRKWTHPQLGNLWEKSAYYLKSVITFKSGRRIGTKKITVILLFGKSVKIGALPVVCVWTDSLGMWWWWVGD